MSNNRKNKGKNQPLKNVPAKDIFDVRENLKKLRSGSDNYSTKSEPFQSDGKPHLSSEATTNPITGYQSYSTDKVDVLRDRIAMDLSIITQKLDDHKEKTNERFSGEISKLRDEINEQGNKFENKNSSFVTNRWFAGVVSVTIIIAGIIYSLSYSKVLSDVKDLKDNQEETDKNIIRKSNQLDNINKSNVIRDSSATQTKASVQKVPAGNSR